MALDPNFQIFQGYLGRESTIVKDGVYIKDFSYLGRPIKDIIYIDFNKDVAPYHTGNTIVLPEFTGDIDDRALYDIIPFLNCKYLLTILPDKPNFVFYLVYSIG